MRARVAKQQSDRNNCEEKERGRATGSWRKLTMVTSTSSTVKSSSTSMVAFTSRTLPSGHAKTGFTATTVEVLPPAAANVEANSATDFKAPPLPPLRQMGNCESSGSMEAARATAINESAITTRAIASKDVWFGRNRDRPQGRFLPFLR